MMPTAACGALPSSGRGGGKDDDNFFKKLLEKLPASVREDVGGVVDNGASQLKAIFESGVPSQVGYGFMMGFASGFCVKKVSKLLAFGLGGVFIMIQSLQYSGYIDVNYKGIQKDIEGMMDLNKDGEFDVKDVELGINKVKDVLSYNMPSGGGFSAGLLMGIRS